MSDVGAEGGSKRKAKAGQAREKAQAASEQVQEKAQPAVGQARDKAQEVRGQAGSRAKEQLDQRSTQAGEEVSLLAQAARRSGEELRSEGKERPASVIEQVAEQAERLASYLRESSGDRILADVRQAAGRQPWLVAASGFVVGLAGARFLKASSAGGQGDGRPAEHQVDYSRSEAEVAAPAGPVGPGALPPTAQPPVPPTATGAEEISR